MIFAIKIEMVSFEKYILIFDNPDPLPSPFSVIHRFR